jgi:hypothetical protein
MAPRRLGEMGSCVSCHRNFHAAFEAILRDSPETELIEIVD